MVAILAACGGSAGADEGFAPVATRQLPAVAPVELPPLDGFRPQADGSQRAVLDADAFFATGAAELQPGEAERLAELLPGIEGHDGEVAIVGYTDGRGATADNVDLSERRAAAVRDWLVGQGLPAEALTTEGRGEQGAADGVDDPTRRRVEVVLR